MNTTQYATASDAILNVTDEKDLTGVRIHLATGTQALSEGKPDIAGAMLDEAAARAGIITDEKLRILHRARLAGSRS
jgi:hypothetical protein